jgi:phosphodiesterase/alkaline phosphatase D-like protein
MSWDTSTDAATYHLQLATDPSFISLVLDDSTLADTSRRVDGLAARTVYYWRVQANNEAGASAWSDPVWEFTTAPSTFVDENGSPDNFSLYQNYPNPFNPRTKITFSVPVASDVRLSVLNLLGQEVTQLVNEHLGAGTYRIEFSGEGLSNGVYFYRMTAGTFTSMRRMILLK